MARQRASEQDAGNGGNGGSGGNESGELRSSPEVQTGLIPGNTFGAKAVRYAVVDGLAIFEGDIVLGTAEEAEQRTQELRDVLTGVTASAVAITGPQFRWPNCQIPYRIDAGLPNQQRVTDAIAHWESRTRYQFVLRTDANAASFPDFVTFRAAGGCSSAVGKQGGEQFVNLGPNCTAGNAIHEIGHVVGLWHEQSREDRDSFVTIHLDKVMAGFEHNFDQHITDGDDIGAYDYGSIMHYPRDAFSVDGSDTITPTDATAQIGQRTALSAGDIAAANSFCPGKRPIKDVAKDPLIDVTRKETIKDIRLDTIKERIRDTFKEQIKDVVKDRKEPIFDQPRKGLFEQPGPGPLTGPLTIQPATGEAVPFAVAAPHQAPAAGGGQGPAEDLEQAIAELDAHLQELAAHLAQVEGDRATLQSQYDELAASLQQLLEQHDQASG
jgi:Astacin (Peptidase family M12A)